MGIQKSEIHRDGSVYYLRLSEHCWLRMDCSGKEAEEVTEPKGKALIPYPDEGWHDPPTGIMRTFQVARLALEIGKRLEKQESERKAITVSMHKKSARETDSVSVRKPARNGHAHQKSA